ncbi:hypothetical protein [Phytoactinopolyspora halotolerans]|uniref:Heparin-sulfate lyase N-terminal domain-containing protein n=1 Tax=Phytoactinopolyspora halotolerans TaxID=1981512 RepID=A0A6L9SJ11_9ACTN|nr:hypothetical protein [Phytoactinopolyspora halotolerans]NEE04678.1 hypothetical protein [Phytoactinopolyspora halotolerans]
MEPNGMDRRNFLRTASAGLIAIPSALTWMAGAASPSTRSSVALTDDGEVDEPALSVLVNAADEIGSGALRSDVGAGSPRSQARTIRRLVAPFVSPRSQHHHSGAFVDSILERLRVLERQQHDNGTFTIGNIQSPPDTGFLIEDLGVMVSLLRVDDHPRRRALAQPIERMMRRAGSGLVNGGVHTPNHRWKIVSALARINDVRPDAAYVQRIDDWLAEGIDQFPDAMYSERSPTYAAEVTNLSLLAAAWVLDRPELLDGVRRNLEMYLYLTEENGEVEAIHSRRQDQDHRLKYVRDFYLQYREFALRDHDGRFTAVVKGIEQRDAGHLGDAFANVLERPELIAVLPEPSELPTDYAEFFPSAQLARVRRGTTSASVFGGTDWYHDGEQTHLFNRIGSGISTNPTFLKLRRGEAVLEAVRMSPVFFSMGHFRSNGLEVVDDGVYRLHNELAIPYALPLPDEHRREDGDYRHTNSIDGRYFSKLDFPNRPHHFVTLRSQVLVTEVTGGFDLDFTVDETDDVNVTIELSFRSGGELTGVESLDDDGAYRLLGGHGSYRVGDDVITFGPGNDTGVVDMASGEQYSVHNGNLPPLSDTRVYITGVTPFEHRLEIRFE